MKIQEKRHFKISDNITMQEDSLLNLVSRGSIEEYITFITNSINQIQNTKSPRIIILESWFLLDYTIRQLIIWGVGAKTPNDEDFDLANKLLPTSFQQCISFLEKFVNYQSSLPISPTDEHVSLQFGFRAYIHKCIKAEEKKIILDVIDRYNKTVDPNYLTAKEKKEKVDIDLKTFVQTTKREQIKYRTVDSHWIKTTSNINKSWIKSVKKINAVRNIAAHSYNEENIYLNFGINGNEKIKKLRTKCIVSIEQLLKINIEN